MICFVLGLMVGVIVGIVAVLSVILSQTKKTFEEPSKSNKL